MLQYYVFLEQNYFLFGSNIAIVIHCISVFCQLFILTGDSKLISSTDYINAVYVDGYKMKHSFIATQAPLPDTVKDLWTIVLENHVTTIVILYSVDEEGLEYPQFWPDGDDAKFDHYTVKLKSQTKMDRLVQKRLQIIGKKVRIQSVLTVFY